MKLPLQTVFRNIRKSEWIEQAVQERASKLESFCNRITRCRVTIQMPHRRHHQGNLFKVRIDLTVPGKEFVINQENDEHAAYQDFNVALRDAFDSARRQLEDYMRRRRGTVKSHESLPRAQVIQLFPKERYGFLETFDGMQVYFHANSLINAKFDQLTIGTEVAVAEEQGDQGLQASSVRVVQKYKAT